MGILVPLLASFAVLVGSTVLVATVGRRRQRGRALERSSIQAIAGVIGVELAELVGGAVELRRQIEDAVASGREMLTIEVQLGPQLRRPLWRQIEDANFGHQLASVRRDAQRWLARFDALDPAERQIVELLGLDVAPVRALLELERYDWEADRREQPSTAAASRRDGELSQVLHRSTAAIACLRRIERELSDYRPSGYR